MPRSGGVYLQLYERLRDDITGGAYPFGARFPSKRTMAEESGVSIMTVEHAYSILCDEGYLVSRERSGYFVAYRDMDLLSVPEEAAPAHLPLSVPERFSRPDRHRIRSRIPLRTHRTAAGKGSRLCCRRSFIQYDSARVSFPGRDTRPPAHGNRRCQNRCPMEQQCICSSCHAIPQFPDHDHGQRIQTA